MIKSMRQFFELRIQKAVIESSDDSEQALQLATAALLIEATRADYHVTDEERAAVDQSLMKLFKLSEEETQELVGLAEQEVNDSVSLYQFTNIVDKQFSTEQKIHVVELLWRVTYSDDHKDMHEESLVRKIADLLHVSHKDFIKARHRVEDNIE